MEVNANPVPRPRALLDAGERIAEFLVGPVSVHHVVVLRILLGLVLFTKYLVLAPVMPDIYGPGGLVDLAGRRGEIPSFVVAHWHGLWLATVVGAGCYAIGLLPRLCGALAVTGHILFHSSTTGTAWGDGTMLHAFIIYTLFAPIGARLSLQRLILRRVGGESEVRTHMSAWPLRLVQAHVTAMYIRAGWNRLSSRGWLSGRMVFVALSHSNFSRFPAVEWVHFRTPLWLGNWYTMVMEVCAPFLLWVRSTRPWWALGLILLHLGLELTSTIGWWQYTMMFALTSFLPTRWIVSTVVRAERALGLPVPPEEDPEAAL